MSHSFRPGDLITVSVAGRTRRLRVVPPEVAAGAFPVVWACSEIEWEAAEAEGRRPEGMAWPLSYVTPLAMTDRAD